MKNTIIYVDGFNLYYSLKGTPFKWLDIQKLSNYYLSQEKHKVSQIKYFTAPVKEKSHDPSNTIRQNIYLRAVRLIPNIEIIFGQFKKRQVTGIKCHYKNQKYMEGDKLVTINKWEEKKSDVNIATQLVADAYQNKYDCAVLISNDTDLTPPLLHIKHKLKKLVIVISPYNTIHADLKKSCHFYKTISLQELKKCQFPEKMQDAKGAFFCPSKWRQESK